MVRATKEFWSDSLFKCIEALCRHLSLSGWKKYHLPIWESNFVDLCLFLPLTRLHTGATFMEILPGTASKIRYGYGQNFVACRVTISAYQSIAGLVRIIRCTCELLLPFSKHLAQPPRRDFLCTCLPPKYLDFFSTPAQRILLNL